VTVLWNQGVYTDKEVTANKPDVVIKNKKEQTYVLLDVAIPAGRNVTQKEAENILKYKEFMYRDTTNVEHEICGYIRGKWGHRNGNKRFKEKFISHTRKTFNRFATEDSCTWNITRNTERTAVWNLIPERWGSPLVLEKYQREMACDKDRA
jgi:hypothetical protein